MATETTQNVEGQAQVELNEHAPNQVPTRHLLHKLFIVVSVLTALVAMWMGTGQILGIAVYENGPVDYVLRGYVILLCLIVILVELEWPAFARESAVLHNWVSRGLLYVFIGVIGMQENETAVLKNEEYHSYEVMTDIIKAVAWNMAGCGLLYFVMGLLCLQLLLHRMRKDYQARLELSKEQKKQAQEGVNNDIESGGDLVDLEAKDSGESHQENDAANVIATDEKDDVRGSTLDIAEAPKGHGAENISVDSAGSSIKDQDKDEVSVESSTNDIVEND